MGTYHASKLVDRRVEPEGLVDDGVEIGKTIRKLIVRGVCTVLEKFVSQLCLHVWVARELQ